MKFLGKIKNGAMWVALAAMALSPFGLLSPTVAQAAGEFVVTGTGADDYDTLTAAIAASGTGSVITIAAGTYGENVVVNKSVTIQADGEVIWSLSDYDASNIHIDANNVTITGLTVQTGSVVGKGGAGAPYAGIYLDKVSGCTISNNTITGHHDGIYLAAGSNHNTFTNNDVSNNVNHGFEIIESQDNIFTGNTANSMNLADSGDGIYTTAGYGFKLANSSNNIFTNNTANLNKKDGFNLGASTDDSILFDESNDNTFIGNTANLNIRTGIRINGSHGNTITGNILNLNTGTGIYAGPYGTSYVTGLTIDHNSITGSAKGIEIADTVTPATWTVTNNDLTNTLAISNLSTGNTLTAPLNWFGSATGPYAATNLTGTGSPVTTLVTFTGWAVDPTIQYRAHVQNEGWQSWVASRATAGTTGQSLRAEAIQIELIGASNGSSVEYRAHVQNEGWQAWVADGATAGTTGQSLRMEAVQIRLVSGDTVWYRAHVQNIGWQGTVTDSMTAGTTGQSLRMEAVQIDVL